MDPVRSGCLGTRGLFFGYPADFNIDLKYTAGKNYGIVKSMENLIVFLNS